MLILLQRNLNPLKIATCVSNCICCNHVVIIGKLFLMLRAFLVDYSATTSENGRTVEHQLVKATVKLKSVQENAMGYSSSQLD